VLRFMAHPTESDQIRIVVVALLAPQFLVVDLQILAGTTVLTSPAIPPQHLLSESFVRLRIKSETRPLGSNSLHDAFSVTSCRKACR